MVIRTDEKDQGTSNEGRNKIRGVRRGMPSSLQEMQIFPILIGGFLFPIPRETQ
ncbi:MAG: hypothetical protein WCP97_04020 [bacterium]